MAEQEDDFEFTNVSELSRPRRIASSAIRRLPLTEEDIARRSEEFGRTYLEPAPKTAKELGESYLYGAIPGIVSAIPGLPADIGTLATLPFGETGRGIRRAIEPATSAGISESISEAMSGREMTERERSGAVLGSILGGAGVGRLARGTVRGATRVMPESRLPFPAREVAARDAENLGIAISQPQLRREVPETMAATKAVRAQNDRRFVEIASAPTGASTTVRSGQMAGITPEFLEARRTSLGQEYDRIFAPNTRFRVDRQSLDGLAQIETLERNVVPAQVTKARDAARNILQRAAEAQQAAGPDVRVTSVIVPGDELQRLRTELNKVSRSATDPVDRYAAFRTLNEINESIARNNPAVQAQLNVINPQYRATMTLTDLYEKDGIRNGVVSPAKLGELLRTQGDLNNARHPLSQLGRIGDELDLRASWERTASEPSLAKAVKDVAGVAGRTRTAREVMREEAARRYGLPQPQRPQRFPAGAIPPAAAQSQPPEGETDWFSFYDNR